MERVSIIEGSVGILLLCPHGPDDDFTDVITERVAKEIGAYAIINRGWERADAVDADNDKANCNNVEHLHEDVVKEEFLEPLVKIINTLEFEDENNSTEIFIIHGAGDVIRKTSKTNVDVILGYGAAGKTNKPSHSCSESRKNSMLYSLSTQRLLAFPGDGDGKFAGRSRNNLNQYFRKWMLDENIHSMQLEIVRSTREDIVGLSEKLSKAIVSHMHHLEAGMIKTLNGTIKYKHSDYPLGWEALVGGLMPI